MFEETPHRSNAKKEEMLNQMKLLDQIDTENKIQKARQEEEYVSPNDETADPDSIFNGGVGNDGPDGRRNKPDNNGSDNADEVLDASEEGNDEGVNVTAVDDWDRSKVKNYLAQ